MWGYGIVLADIQVTVTSEGQEPQYIDCLQKVYGLGPCIVGAFSGRVDLGFQFLGHLQKWLVIEEDRPDEWGWFPEFVAENWSTEAAAAYAGLPARALGPVEILFVATHPTENNGIPGMPKTFGYTMKAPDFVPRRIRRTEVRAIGSGNQFQQYKQAISELNAQGLTHPLHQMEANSPDGFATGLIIHISDCVEEHPVTGISKHLHLGICRHKKYKIVSNNHTRFLSDGTEEEVVMPHVAKCWSEYRQIMRDRGFGDLAVTESKC